jgi:hypothetical protein
LLEPGFAWRNRSAGGFGETGRVAPGWGGRGGWAEVPEGATLSGFHATSA